MKVRMALNDTEEKLSLLNLDSLLDSAGLSSDLSEEGREELARVYGLRDSLAMAGGGETPMSRVEDLRAPAQIREKLQEVKQQLEEEEAEAREGQSNALREAEENLKDEEVNVARPKLQLARRNMERMGVMETKKRREEEEDANPLKLPRERVEQMMSELEKLLELEEQAKEMSSALVKKANEVEEEARRRMRSEDGEGKLQAMLLLRKSEELLRKADALPVEAKEEGDE
mmetsp:Transcript_3422/g.8315  ORF Transcript_3422/g.8315 Transcript_3422/m.8315 type:complete len:230 (-) Transcript_3422:2807-3496(-)